MLDLIETFELRIKEDYLRQTQLMATIINMSIARATRHTRPGDNKFPT